MAKYYGGVAEGPTFWDYISYSPDNPLLRPISEAGRVTGVQAVSKKGLMIAGGAGTGFRQAMGYGEQYNITQEQAGEIGYFAGSLVTPGGWLVKGAGVGKAVGQFGKAEGLIKATGKWKEGEGLIKATGKLYEGTKKAQILTEEVAGARFVGTAGQFGKEIPKGEGLFAKMFGKTPEVAKVPKAARITEVGAEISPKIAAAEKGLPWTTYAGKGLKYGAIAGGGAAALYLGGKAVGGAGSWIDRVFGVTPGGVTPGGVTPSSQWPPTPWQGAGGETGGFLGNLGAGLGAPGVGIGQNIVPLAIIGGGIYLITKEMGKRKSRKDKGKKRT